jgi:hypothetical protein
VSAISQIVHQLISDLVTPEVLIFADQNAPRPPLPYWTIRLSTQRLVGKDSYSQGVDNNGDQAVSGVREITVQVQRLGENSVDFCADLRDSLSRTTVNETWQVEKIALYDVGDVLNIPYKLDNSQLEPRASIDLFIRFGTEILDRVGWVETVETNANYVTNQSLDIEETNLDLAETIVVVL